MSPSCRRSTGVTLTIALAGCLCRSSERSTRVCAARSSCEEGDGGVVDSFPLALRPSGERATARSQGHRMPGPCPRVTRARDVGTSTHGEGQAIVNRGRRCRKPKTPSPRPSRLARWLATPRISRLCRLRTTGSASSRIWLPAAPLHAPWGGPQEPEVPKWRRSWDKARCLRDEWTAVAPEWISWAEHRGTIPPSATRLWAWTFRRRWSLLPVKQIPRAATRLRMRRRLGCPPLR